MIECPSCDFENADQAPACQKCAAPLFGRDPVCAMPTFGGDSTGQVLDRRYVILQKTGIDDAGVIYQADDAENNTPVTIRALPTIITDDPALIDEIRKKAKTILNLTHDNIAALLGFQLDGPVKYFVSQYAPGTTLEQRLSSSGPLTIGQAAAVFGPLGEALDYAHSQNHLHGDINPANIILTPHGVPKLANFEITRWIKDSLSRVNADQADDASLHSAPEQFRTGKSHQRSDIYSFAATIYQSICRPPRIWRGWIEYQVLNETPAPLNELTDEQNAALLKALARDSRYRYRSTYKFLADLSLNSSPSSTAQQPIKDDRPEDLNEQPANKMARRIKSDPQAKIEAKLKAETEARLKAEEKAAQEAKARARAEERATAEAEKLAEETKARTKAEQKAAEETKARTKAEQKAAQETHARKLAEEKAQAETEKLAEETKARTKAEQKAAEETQARKQAEEKTQAETEKLAEETKARTQAEQKAAQETQARKHAEEKAKAEAGKHAEEARARDQAEKKAAKEAKERAAAEEKARAEAQKIANEAQAKENAEKRAAQEAEARARAEERAKAEAEKLAAETRAKQKAEKRAVEETRARVIAEEKTRIEAKKLAELETQNHQRIQEQAEERKQALEKQHAEAEKMARLETEIKKQAEADARKTAKTEAKAKAKARNQAYKEAIAKAQKKAQDEAAARAETEIKLAEQIKARSAIEEQAREYAQELVLAQTTGPSDEIAIDLEAQQFAQTNLTPQIQPPKPAPKSGMLTRVLTVAAIVIIAIPAVALYISYIAAPPRAVEALAKAQLAASRLNYQEALNAAEAIIAEFPKYAKKHSISQIKDAWQQALTNADALQIWQKIDQLIAQSEYEKAITQADGLLNKYPNTPSAAKAILALPAWRSLLDVNKQIAGLLAKAKTAQDANDLDAALAAATSALDLNPDNAAAAVLKAEVQAAKQTQLKLQQIAAQKLKQLDTLINQALSYQNAKDFELAIDIYIKASVLMPEDPRIVDGLAFCRYSVHLSNARAAQSTDDFDSAMKSYTKAFEFANKPELKKSLESTIAALELRRQAEETKRLVTQWLSTAAKAEAAGELDTAVEWYQKAADANDPTAMHKLALAYYNGNGIDQNIVDTVEWLEKAADAGNSDSMLKLGLIYHAGDGIEKNLKKAFELYHKAAKAENPEAMHNLGAMYYAGEGTEKDIPQAVRWLEKAAAAGNVQAMYNVAIAYYNGQGITQDYTKAVEWFRKAADANDLAAIYNLALAYLDIADYTNAKKRFEKAAETGNIEAMYNLGVMYYNGYGVNRDFETAGQWYSKAAQAGETNAMVNLGLMHDEGIGTPKDPDKAVQWYQKAADAGNPRAMSNLAMAYYQGNGLEKNQQKALEWLQKAADLGENLAMFNLGLIYQQGQNVQKDLPKAADWYKKAAQAGDPQAMLNLALMYQKGEGVPKDPEQTALWLKKAADLGHPQAKEELKKLKKTE